MPDVKQTFIIQQLQEYSQRVIQGMQQAMIQKKVKDTGASMNSFAYQVLQSGKGAIASITFAEYLRFVDMGVGRGHPLGGLMATEVTLLSQRKKGLALVKDKTFRAKKIYAKVAYGNLGFLMSGLAYGFTQEAIAAIKESIQNDNVNPQ